MEEIELLDGCNLNYAEEFSFKLNESLGNVEISDFDDSVYLSLEIFEYAINKYLELKEKQNK